MKQRYNFILVSHVRISGRDIGTRLEITAEAAQAEGTLVIRAEMLTGNDVVDLMRENRCTLRYFTTLTGILGATADEHATWLSHPNGQFLKGP